MTSLFLAALLLPGASGLYLYVVAWCVRASKQRVFSLPWLFLPLGGALIAGLTLALSVPASPAVPISLRLLELLAHLCAILLIWIIAGRIAPSYRLAGTWLYAWNPLVLIELAVYANTAGVAICLLLLAVLLLMMRTSPTFFAGIAPAFRRGGGGVDDGRGRLRRSPSFEERFVNIREEAGDASVPSQPDPTPAPTERERSFFWSRFSEIAALALVGLAMRIDLMTLLLAPLLLWFMVRNRRSVGAALLGFMWRALVVLLIFALAYLPDWQGSETFLAITNGLRLLDFANSPLGLIVTPTRSFFTFVAQRAHFPPLMKPAIAADMMVLASSFFLFVLLYLREMGRVRTGSEDGARQNDALFTGWAVVIVGYIVLAVTVFLPGYIVWGMWVVALRRFDTLSICVLLLSCSALLYYPLQWFALASTGFLVPLCVFGIPLVYLVVHNWMLASRMERKKVLK